MSSKMHKLFNIKIVALFVILFSIVLLSVLYIFIIGRKNDYKIIFSSDTYTMYVGDKIRILYTIIPDDANSSIAWKVVDDSVIDISNDGEIYAKHIGKTKAIASIGTTTATCEVTVVKPIEEKTLSSAEQEFVNAILTVLDEFRNPQSVTVNSVRARDDGTGWDVEVTAENGFGGNSVESYYIDKNYIRKKSKNDVIHDAKYNLENINEAIKDK